jgi:hypothetical protein
MKILHQWTFVIYIDAEADKETVKETCHILMGQTEHCILLLHAGFLFSLIFDPEDGGDMFLRYVGWILPDYEALQPDTVAEQSKACTVFARSEAGILGSIV